MNNKKLVTNSILYVINNILTKAFQFFLVPIYTAYLTTAEYGTSNLISNFIAIGSVLISLSIGSATAKFFSELQNDEEKSRRLFGSLYLFVVFCGLISCAVVYCFGNVISEHVFGGVPFYPTIAAVIVSLWVQGIADQYKGMLQARQEAKIYTFVSLLGFCLQLGLNIVLIIYFGMGVFGIVLSTIIANIVIIAVSLVDIFRRRLIAWTVDFSIVKDALKYSVPLVPHNLSSTIAQFLSRVFIGKSHSLSAIGIYGLAGQFGHIVDTVQNSVQAAYLPWFFEQMNVSKENAIKRVKEAIPMLLNVYNVFFLGVMLFSQEAIKLVASESYFEAWKLIPLFVVEYAIKTPYYFYVSFLFHDRERAKFIFVASFSGNMVNIILAAILVPVMGMYGALAADAVAICLQLSIVIWLCKGENKPYFRYPIFLKSVIPLVILGGIGLVPSYMMPNNGYSYWLILYKAVIWLCFTAFILKKYAPEVQAMIKNMKERGKK